MQISGIILLASRLVASKPLSLAQPV